MSNFTQSTAQETFQQLGGTNRLSVMVGAKNFTFSGDESFIAFKWVAKSPTCKANYLKVVYNSNDTYTMKFLRVYGQKVTEIKEYSDVYCDQLIELFENTTGLYLTL